MENESFVSNEFDLEGFKKKVVRIYACKVPKDKITKYVLSNGNYIWHLFSWNLLGDEKYFTGEEAKSAFDASDKTKAYVFYEKAPMPFFKISDEFLTSKQINNHGEIYVFAEDLSWIYFGTHEESCGLGPYFIQK